MKTVLFILAGIAALPVSVALIGLMFYTLDRMPWLLVPLFIGGAAVAWWIRRATLSHRARKRLSLLVLAVWLPLYIIAALKLTWLMDRPSILLELALYVGLGVLWALPMKPLFRGVGQAGPPGPTP